MRTIANLLVLAALTSGCVVEIAPDEDAAEQSSAYDYEQNCEYDDWTAPDGTSGWEFRDLTTGCRLAGPILDADIYEPVNVIATREGDCSDWEGDETFDLGATGNMEKFQGGCAEIYSQGNQVPDYCKGSWDHTMLPNPECAKYYLTPTPGAGGGSGITPGPSLLNPYDEEDDDSESPGSGPADDAPPPPDDEDDDDGDDDLLGPAKPYE